LVFRAGGKKVVGKTGTFLHVPRGVPHHFRNESDADATLLIWFGPAGIESMMERMAADPDHYEAIGKEYGVEFVPEA
jgi:quercetin dioxygenase-like cupin family protein